MKRLIDYDEMNEILGNLNSDIIEKCDPIGFTNFGFPIDHYKYGNGFNHVIITGGTHSAEIISNVFVVRFMEKLSNGEINIDSSLYTIHFIPFVNPEGSVIVSSAIRSLIDKDMSEDVVQTYLLTYYRNCQIEGDYSIKYGDKSEKLQSMMFRHSSPSDLEGNLGRSVDDLFKKYNLPKGCMINWSSNGRGVDLNSNIESSSFIDRVLNGEEVYAKLHLNNIKRNVPGPLGCPFFERPGEIEPENTSLLNFYTEIQKKYNLIGSFIYHSCGNIVYYLSESKYENPWKKDFGRKDALKNYKVASMYSKSAGYKLCGMEKYTTMDSKLKTLFPVTLLIELGGVRAHPLSQFMDFDIPESNEDFKYVYTKIINNNTKAIIDTLPVMLEVSKKVY